MNHLKHSFEDMNINDLTRAISIPIPVAMFGVLVSFMFGWTVGSMMSRKHAAAVSGHDAHWKHMKTLKEHHHHADGSPCGCKEGIENESEPAGKREAAPMSGLE